MENKTVSIVIPIHKRLQHLPDVLRLLEAQDYPAIELIVSDNGTNGTAVQDIIRAHCKRPCVFRQNPTSVDIRTHFNQLIAAAQGEYFIIMADDDEITPNFVSELVARLQQHTGACIAFGGQEVFDESGKILGRSVEPLPEVLTGPEFIRATWRDYRFRFKTVSTFLAKTESVRACGGYPDLCRGTHIDNALVIKLSLLGDVALSHRCAFRNRFYETSHGMALNIGDFAKATRQFMAFLDTDPDLSSYGAKNQAEWKGLKDSLKQMAWRAYFTRWETLYRRRLSYLGWVKAAFLLPPIPGYYRKVARTIFDWTKSSSAAVATNLFMNLDMTGPL